MEHIVGIPVRYDQGLTRHNVQKNRYVTILKRDDCVCDPDPSWLAANVAVKAPALWVPSAKGSTGSHHVSVIEHQKLYRFHEWTLSRGGRRDRQRPIINSDEI